MIINHNLAANNAIRNMNINTSNASKSMQKLSSGMRINTAADDAAGLAISEKMRGQIRGLDQASANSQDAISLIQTGEGALNETTSILQRMRELAVQSATDTNTADDRAKIQTETDQLAKEITRISNTTEFNTQNLLAGGLSNTFQIGANKDQYIALQIGAMDAYSLGVAGSTATSNNFAGGGTNISGVSSTGRGMTTDTGYQIVANKTNASLSAAVAIGVNGSGTSDASGALNTTAYTGTSALSYTVKILGVDGTNKGATSAAYSTDGGATYTLASVTDNAGNSVVNLNNGLQLTITDATTTMSVNDTFTFGITPSTTTLQLEDSTNAPIGTAVTVNYANTNAVIGDTTTNKTVTVGFTYSSLTSNTATFDVVASNSTAATTVNGEVTAEADTKAGIAVNTQTAANDAIETIDKAINTVSAERSKLGAYSNRLEHTIANLGTSSENLTSAESRIRDVDMAKEMSEFSKNNILSQAAQAMLAQANQQPQQVLQLLR